MIPANYKNGALRETHKVVWNTPVWLSIIKSFNANCISQSRVEAPIHHSFHKSSRSLENFWNTFIFRGFRASINQQQGPWSHETFITRLYLIILIDSFHYLRNYSTYLSSSRSFSMPWASFSMLDGPGGTGCDVPVRGCWVRRDVIVAAVYDCVKECMGFVMYLII